MSEEYQFTTEAIDKYYSGTDAWQVISNNNIKPGDAETVLGHVPNVDVVKSDNGKILSYNFKASENVASDAAEAINSNTPPNVKSFDIPANTAVDSGGNMTFVSGMSKAGNFVFTKVVPAIAAAGVGIELGKTIDRVLYNAYPDFWDEKGMSSLNPDEWNNIVSNDTMGGRLFNMVFGLNPDGTTQAYIDQNAFAYMASYMQNKGAFDDKVEIEPDDYIITHYPDYANANIYMSTGDAYATRKDGFMQYILTYDHSTNVYKGFVQARRDHTGIITSLNPFKYGYSSDPPSVKITAAVHSMNNKTYYIGTTTYNGSYKWVSFDPQVSTFGTLTDVDPYIWAYIVLFGHKTTIDRIKGIGTQDGAKTPDLSGATTVQETLDALKQQYPELFAQAVTQNVVQPDGSTVTYTYVPIAMPEMTPEGNPISSTSTQANPQIDPATATAPLLDVITKLLQKDNPVNPPDTGSGDSPIVVPATGSASALYAIYNPTLSQINAFGAWLWSDNFIDQIKKLFNDPMQAIIGLHKVYATPATSGAQNIKVGYLDSGVSANVVSNQYTTIDCGTVTLSEYFHNVFDYSPYTQINLYLPFIGIVNLDNADVMRSSIHIIYHVDVLSGACLAEVKVTRDGAGGTLYQYTGNASVTLPISSGSYMGIVTSIASIAGGIAGTIASGGAALPMLASAAGSALNARAKVEHSGGFSGNAGAMGGKIPYLIISRPQVTLANNFQKYIGYPANYTTKLSTCSGYVKVLECHIEHVNATNSELTEIESLLKEGVII